MASTLSGELHHMRSEVRAWASVAGHGLALGVADPLAEAHETGGAPAVRRALLAAAGFPAAIREHVAELRTVIRTRRGVRGAKIPTVLRRLDRACVGLSRAVGYHDRLLLVQRTIDLCAGIRETSTVAECAEAVADQQRRFAFLSVAEGLCAQYEACVRAADEACPREEAAEAAGGVGYEEALEAAWTVHDLLRATVVGGLGHALEPADQPPPAWCAHGATPEDLAALAQRLWGLLGRFDVVATSARWFQCALRPGAAPGTLTGEALECFAELDAELAALACELGVRVDEARSRAPAVDCPDPPAVLAPFAGAVLHAQQLHAAVHAFVRLLSPREEEPEAKRRRPD